ncbi:MAG: hypothetical protein AAF851_00885 [Myxococcota bacterium]
MLSLMLAGLATAAPTVEDGQYFLSHSEIGLELGTFARDSATTFAPLLHTRLRVIEPLVFELDIPFAIQDGGGQGTSVIGNIGLSGRFLAKLEDVGFFEVGFGVSIPTGFISEDNALQDSIAQGRAGSLLGLQPAYRYGENLFAVFVPLGLELASSGNSYVLMDGEMAILASTSDDGGSIIAPSEVGGTMAFLIRGGYRPGPFDLSVGFGTTAFLGDGYVFSGDNDIEAQVFVEPGVAFRVGPESELSGLEVGSRLRVLLDAPLGGNGFEDGFYGLFFDVRHRFDFLN